MKRMIRVILIALAAITTSLSFADELLEHQSPTSDSSSAFCSSCKRIAQMFEQFGSATDAPIFQSDAPMFFDLDVVGSIYDVRASFSDLLLNARTYAFSILGNDSNAASWYVSDITADSRAFQIDMDGTRNRINVDQAYRLIDSEATEQGTIMLFFLRLQNFIAALRQHLFSH
jgi:thiol-disulfide isomerase/thioredoxin